MRDPEVSEESMESSSVVPDGVRELLEQRSTYRRWLERLDEVGADYRPAVAERVRGDYEDRLAGVAQELDGHRHELESSAKRRRDHLEELSGAFEARSAELEEAELRFQVGEFDDGTWEKMRTELNEGLEEIESELADARAAVDELEQILGELTEEAGSGARGSATESGGASARPHPPLKAVDGGLSDERGAARQPDGRGPAGADDEEAASEPDVDLDAATMAEGADSSGDEDTPSEEASVAVAASGSPERTSKDAMAERSTAREAEAEEYRDELEFLESLSLDDPDSFDAVSRMLEDEEDR